jgi:chorismate mutase
MQIESRNLLLIAGPCSAESESQVMETAQQLMQYCKPDVFRAGIWKARTRMNTFEGIGEKALGWLSLVKSTYNIPVATEVLTPRHAELCLQAGIDYLWLGARTVVNPFIVSEICSVLQGADVKVMVKNPVNPDIKLWTGAIERVSNAGIKEIFAIHRGFSTFFSSPYRNMPLWEIPNELNRLMPELPLICDPSHICGKTACIEDIMQQALDLEMNGLMIETHFDPVKALSDSEQQLTPHDLSKMLSQLIIRSRSDARHQELLRLRSEIDMIDDQLLEHLSRRMQKVEEIGKLKCKYNMTILQSDRSRHVFADRIEKGNSMKLQPHFLKEILKAIHSEAIRIQIEIFRENQ